MEERTFHTIRLRATTDYAQKHLFAHDATVEAAARECGLEITHFEFGPAVRDYLFEGTEAERERLVALLRDRGLPIAEAAPTAQVDAQDAARATGKEESRGTE